MEGLNMLPKIGRVLAFEHGATQPDLCVYLTDALIVLADVDEVRPDWTRSRPT